MTSNVPRLTLPFLLLCAGAASLLGCLGAASEGSQKGGEPLRVPLGQEFKVRVGQRAAVEREGEGFRVRFASVANDSRCPADVQCVWAGNAEVLVEAEAGVGPASVKLNTHGGDRLPTEGRHERYSVGLVALDPYPVRSSVIKAEDYVATLVIRKE